MMISDRPKKVLLVVAGVTSVILGTVGIVVPLLPTTPFLLLAAACFVRSSDRLHQWLINHRLFGSYIRNYREHHAVTWQTKVFTLLLLWVAVGYSGLAIVNSGIVRAILLVIAVAVTVHVLSLSTLAKAKDTTRSGAVPEEKSQ
jgi:uncharacterized membrane protein YbaN (DUF454 family)